MIHIAGINQVLNTIERKATELSFPVVLVFPSLAQLALSLSALLLSNLVLFACSCCGMRDKKYVSQSRLSPAGQLHTSLVIGPKVSWGVHSAGYLGSF